ncbi:ABC transporter substrate-binding protein [Mycolicibacterium sp. P9-64]|uniref:ABC transporter substrate-binding protein n=1 Tax=Mycolicibacterium sp. P9-64 TaxID=2024612 RepID=UPI001566AA9B|nr:ABC transporter substrate-binding protein [Mycolicibacterium sp. P9-64]
MYLRFARPSLSRTVALALTCITLVACGGVDTGASSSSELPVAQADPTLNAKLPDKIREAGVITVALDVAYPPMEYFDTDGKTMIGLDLDFGRAVAQVLGVEIEFTNLAFPSILTSLQGNRFDMTITAITDTPERRDVVTFVDYLSTSGNVLVAKGNPKGIADFTTLCGRPVGVQAGTTQLADAERRQAACAAAGKPPITLSTFQTNDAANLALSSGRVDAVYSQSIVNTYVMAQAPTTYEVVGEELNKTPIGIAIMKDKTRLIEAVQGAVQKLMDDGIYAKILAKWHLESRAIPTATINGGQ